MKDAELLDIENILRTEGGRKFLFNHLQYCRVNENIFNDDPYRHSFNSGLRSGGIRLEDKLKQASIKLYLKMIEENHDE